MKGLIGVAIVGFLVLVVIVLDWLNVRRNLARERIRDRVFKPDDPEDVEN